MAPPETHAFVWSAPPQTLVWAVKLAVASKTSTNTMQVETKQPCAVEAALLEYSCCPQGHKRVGHEKLSD